MEDLIKNFGITWYYLGAQIANFLIILYILKRFAYKPILEMLEKRKSLIAKGQQDAMKAQEALRKATEQEEDILRKAQSESKKILSDAKNQAEEIVMKANDKGKTQVEKMLSDASEQIQKDRRTMEKELAVNVTRLALDMLKASMAGVIDEKEEEKIVEKAAKKLEKI